MGCWDVFCFICGNPCHEILDGDYTENINIGKYKKITDWMNYCTILTASNEVIHDTQEESCNVDFIKGNNLYVVTPYNVDKKYLRRCIFLHDDCYEYIRKTFNIKLNYSMIKPKNIEELHKYDFCKLETKYKGAPIMIDYGMITKYWGQDFDINQVIKDKKGYILYSPLKSEPKNLSRINKIFRQLKIKEDRKGPSISATFELNGTIRIGNDNNFWIKKQNKWVKLDIKPIIKTVKYGINDIPFIMSVPQICESNKTNLGSLAIRKKKQNKGIVFIKLLDEGKMLIISQ